MFNLVKRCVLIVCILGIIGCKQQNQISMMVPFGNPQLSQLYLQDSKNYQVDIVMGADPLVSAFGSASHDVIIAPSNLGAKFFQAKDDYRLLGVITWGNYYFISEKALSIDQLKHQTVYVFGQNQVSDMLIKIINDYYNLHLTINYLDSLPTASAYAAIHSNDIVLVSNPSALQLKKNNPLFNLLDLGLMYQDISDGKSLPQAGVFVHKRLNRSQKSNIESDLISSIEQLKSHTLDTINLANHFGISWDDDIILESILSNHISYVKAQEAKQSLEVFYAYILAFQPMMIGNHLPSDVFYEGE